MLWIHDNVFAQETENVSLITTSFPEHQKTLNTDQSRAVWDVHAEARVEAIL